MIVSGKSLWAAHLARLLCLAVPVVCIQLIYVLPIERAVGSAPNDVLVATIATSRELSHARHLVKPLLCCEQAPALNRLEGALLLQLLHVCWYHWLQAPLSTGYKPLPLPFPSL